MNDPDMPSHHGPLLRPLLSARGGGVVARRVLPPAIALCVASTALVFLGVRLGLYGSAVGMAVLAGVNLALLTGVIRAAAAAFNAADEAAEQVASALRESEHRIRQLTESLPMFIWTATPEGECDFLSSQWAEYTGPPVDYWGDAWMQYVHEDDRAPTARAWAGARNAGRIHYAQFRVRRHDGVYRWFETRGTPVRNLEGQVVKWFGAAFDVHEARQMQDTLRQQAVLIELAHDPIFTWNTRDGITFWNRGCEQLYGYSKEEALGRRSHELLRTVFPGSREQFELELERDGRWDGELRHTTKSGRERILSSRHQRVEIDGRFIVLEADRDITEQRRSEEGLRRAQRMEALGALSGGIAHDFNNIIAAIHGNANLAIADLPADHPAQESLAEVVRAGRRAADLVRRILTFSQRQHVEHAPVELQTVVEEALSLLRSVLPSQIDLRSDLRGERRVVLADPTQIHQVMMNLVTNAAHAIGDRPGRIEVGLELANPGRGHCHAGTDVTDGSYLCLSVKDDGCGMDAATLERIFEPFFTTKPIGQGTGLGLPVVHGIVKSHGGAIRVESEAGRGSTFYLYVPEAAQEEPSAELPLEAEDVRGRGERILYVDDEEALVFLATRTLERLGYKVEGYTDPAEALRAFRTRAQEFDAAVTDLSMPGMSGIDLARELLRARADLPVTMMTGYLRPEDVSVARQHGVIDVVLKPGAVGDFGSLVRRTLRKRD